MANTFPTVGNNFPFQVDPTKLTPRTPTQPVLNVSKNNGYQISYLKGYPGGVSEGSSNTPHACVKKFDGSGQLLEFLEETLASDIFSSKVFILLGSFSQKMG